MSVKVAIAQLRSTGGDIDANLIKLDNYAALASKQNAKLIITPELYLVGYSTRPLSKIQDLAQTIPSSFHYNKQNVSVLNKIASIAIKNNIDIVIGLSEKQNKSYYNAAVWMSNQGKIRKIYRKTHLWGPIENSIFSPYPKTVENEYNIISCFGINFGILICYDIEFVEPARILALKGCDCILVLTALPECDTHILNSVVISRAVENSLYVIYCDYPQPRYAGGSCCVTPMGTKIANAGSDSEALLFAEIDMNKFQEVRKRNNYLQDRRTELFQDIINTKNYLKSKL